jgi:HNH endonuclease
MTLIDEPADESREPIPAELRRRVLVEAGHRCAIPTCRHIEVDIHHIVPWAQCRAHEYDNLIALCPNCHRRADKGEIDRKALRLYKFNLRFLHDKYSQVEMDVLFGLAKLPDGEFERWPAFNRILLRRIEESGFITVREMMGGMITGGMRVVTDAISLTPKGRAFLEELGLKEF